MAISTFGDLKTAVQDYAARTDSRFVNAIPNFVSLAEQRIYYGSEETIETPELRVRQMEASIDPPPLPAAIPEAQNAAAVTLPKDYLSMRRIFVLTDFTHEFTYLSPQVFWTDVRTSPGIGGIVYSGVGRWPRIYTIEAQRIIVAPHGVGELQVLYYKRFPALAADEDTNWIMQNLPGIYFEATMAEAFKFARNRDRQMEHLQTYAGLARSANSNEIKGRYSGQRLAPQTTTSRITDRGYY